MPPACHSLPTRSIPGMQEVCVLPLSVTFGGDEGNRTLDPLLAGQVLSQLSYTPMCSPVLPAWWAQVDSSLSPQFAYTFVEALAKPLVSFAADPIGLVGSSGLEPPTSCLSGTRSNLLSYEPVSCFRRCLPHRFSFLFASRLQVPGNQTTTT